MAFTSSKIGHALAKFLHINLHYREELGQDNNNITRGESVYSVSSADTFVEQEPTVAEWIRDRLPGAKGVRIYFWNLFPFIHWIGFYNVMWLIGDVVAGVTVATVVVPQSMAYAKLALLPPEFGLYSSFMGVLIYWFFATSKDITIGPVAVMSTVTGNVITKALKSVPEYKDHPEIIASALAVIAGGIVTAIGLLRLGWIVDFISLTAISAFMTGAAITIAVGQVPALLGLKGFSNRNAAYRVTIDSLKHLPNTTLDAAIGLTALLMLYLIRWACNRAAKRNPDRKKTFFFVATLRSAFVMLLYILIGWAVNRHHRDKPSFKILGKVPRGFQHAEVPTLTPKLISAFASELPATVIVLLIEHIAISKSFGRINNYTVNPSQELVAIGVTNLLGPFLGAYPATGSFSRTAIKSKAGVRTPFAGVITALVVLLAIYALPAMFFYIPSASLSAVIIHAVGDLITPPNTVYQFWRISPLEVVIFFAGVFVTVFKGIEEGVYVTVAVSAALLLYRVFKARGRFLGKVKVHSVVGDHLIDGKQDSENTPVNLSSGRGDSDPETSTRNVFLPIDHKDGSNPQVGVDAPHPGIFIYRFSEGFNYPNANHYLDNMVAVIFQQTRRTDTHTFAKLGDRPWNDPGPSRAAIPKTNEDDETRPTLKAIILDFSSVNNVDITSIQNLIDVRNQLDRYAAPDAVDWHFACISNRWTKRALAAAGFGFPAPPTSQDGTFRRWKPIFSVAEIGGSSSAAEAAEVEDARRKSVGRGLKGDVEAGREDFAEDKGVVKELEASQVYGDGLHKGAKIGVTTTRVAVVQGLNRPFFHVDLTSALQSAVSNVEWRRLGRDLRE